MSDAKGRELVFRADPTNESVVIAAEIAGGDRSAAFRALACRHPPDAFLVAEYAAIHKAVREAEHRGLSPDPATLARLSGGQIDITLVTELMAARPDVPDDGTLKFALEQLAWDRQKHIAVTGPIDLLLQAIQKGDDPERCRGLARSVSACFDGWGDRKYLHDPEELVREQIADVRQRMAGRAVYPFGLPGLDCYEAKLPGEEPKRRMLPGAAPGQVTVVTGVPGSGKSTSVARLMLGLARQKRRILCGAWEMKGGTTLELLACLSLGWSRSDLTQGNLDPEDVPKLEARMLALSKFVRFLANPFRRGTGGKPTNERNLDMIHGYLADSGAEVFVADLWKRCLVEARPEDEEEALYRQQAMVEELGVHAILLQQQRLKDIELRPDKRPTREGIKGSGAWTEVADTILGIHRPALWKNVTDNVLEVDVLKQRYGKWPLAVEFDWDADRGMISGGRSVDYEMSVGREGTNPIDAMIREPKPKKDKR
jgi:hypothetical protein